MGYIRHNAIVVTSWRSADIEAAANYAASIGLLVIGPSDEVVNGYRTLLVCPDGSKEGWNESNDGDRRRCDFRIWLDKRGHEDGGNPLEWVEVAYGYDDGNASVEFHAWDRNEGVK